jgi:PAS domain S-box-containing protein
MGQSAESLPQEVIEQRVAERTAHLTTRIAQLETSLQMLQGVEVSLRSSKQWYEQLLNSVTDYIYSVRIVEGQPTSTSHGTACVAVTGYTSEEYEEDPHLWHHMIYPDDRELVVGQISKLLAGETTIPVEHRILHKDGSIRWVRNTPVLRYDDQGNLVAYDGLITDITERRQAEEALRESEERYRALAARLEHHVAERTAQLEAANLDLQRQIAERERAEAALRESEERLELALVGSDDGLWDWNVSTGIDYYSPHWAEMLGYQPEEIEHHPRSWERLIHPDDRPAVMQAFHDHIAGRTPFYESRHRKQTRSGGWKWVLDRGKVVARDKEGRALRMAGTQRDITELKEAEEALHEAKEAAEAANHAKSEFLANMSHEIRTPLNAIIGMTSLMLDTRLDPDQREFAETIYASSNTLLSLINDILDFSKIEDGKMHLETHPFNMQTCVEEALDMVASSAAEKQIGLTYMIDRQAPLNLLGDSTRVRQIMINLLSNAVKFTGRGEVSLMITATPIEPSSPTLLPGHGTPYEIHIAVSDTGIGISSDHMDRLFKSFSQVDASMNRRYGGTGLGLAISKHLAEMMGGKIWLESEVNKGSTFHVTFQSRTVLPEEVAATTTPFLPESQEVAREQERAGLSGKRILIIDDRKTSRQVLTNYVQAWEMRSVAVSAVADVSRSAQPADEYDAVVLNIHEPTTNNMDLVNQVRQSVNSWGCTASDQAQDDRHSRLPCVILWVSPTRKREVETNDKTVLVLSRPIKPSRFYNALLKLFAQHSTPAAGAAQDPAATTPPQAQPTLPPPEVAPAGHLPPKLKTLGQRHPLRILLVEDNIVNQKVALRFLERLGYKADVATNGVEALEVMERASYEVVLMDVQMPEMDGIAATQHIRARWSIQQQPYIIAMTARALQGDREKCLMAGMDDYISKPVHIEHLAAALEKFGTNQHTSAVRHVVAPPPPSPGVGQTTQATDTPHNAAPPPPQNAPSPAASVVATFDPSRLENLRQALGESAHEVLNEIIVTYLKDTPRLLHDMRVAMEQGDVEFFTRSAHSLKSSSAQVGAMSLSTLCKELELLGRAGTVEGTEAHISQAETDYQAVKEKLEAMIAQHSE